MPFIHAYWLDPERKGPYAVFLAMIQTHVHPDSPNFRHMQERANLTENPAWAKFKSDFREVIADPTVLPEGALFTAAEYDDGTDEAFLARLWRELYGDEPPTVTEPAPDR